MASVGTEDMLSDVEPLTSSAASSPPASLTSASPLSHSWPTWPLQTLRSAGQVTDRPNYLRRQVKFKLSNPGDTADSCQSERMLQDGVGEMVNEGKEAVEQLVEKLSLNLQTNLQTRDAVLNGRLHIQDMEKVRSHMQTLLRDKRNPIHLDTSPLLEVNKKEEDSFESDNTSHLLSMDLLFPRYSLMHADLVAPPTSDPHALQERLRRKQCEVQLHVLQEKVLQLQHQLSLAISADSKKDVMIEQLDKTLAKVVEGWRKQEEERNERVQQLQKEKVEAERAQAQQQEVLAHFEQSLSQAAETLDREQKEREKLSSSNQQLRQKLQQLEMRLEEAHKETERLSSELQETRGRLEQHRESWRCEQMQQQERIAQKDADLRQEKAARQLEAEQLQECHQEKRVTQARIRQLETELEEARRERERIQTDRTLEQARFEAHHSQLQVEMKLSVEQQVTNRLAALQKENAETTAALREQHTKQVLELSAQHERELSVQLSHFKRDLQDREERQRRLVEDYERRLCAVREEAQRVEASRKKLETQQAVLVSRLQSLMRSHWTEALRLLTSQTEVSPILPEDGSREMEDVMDCPGFEHLTEGPCAVPLMPSRRRVDIGGGDCNNSLNNSNSFAPLQPMLDVSVASVAGAGVVIEPAEEDVQIWMRTDDEQHCNSVTADDITMATASNWQRWAIDEGHGLGREDKQMLQRNDSPERSKSYTSPTPVTPVIERDGRQSQLQHYVSMLLDRCPAELTNIPGSTCVPPGGAAWTQQTCPIAPPPKPLSSAVTKTKLCPESVQKEARAAHVGWPLSQPHPHPGPTHPPLHEILTYLLTGQADRLQLPGEPEQDVTLQIQPQLKRAEQKKRPCDISRSQEQRSRRNTRKTSKPPPNHGNVWR